MSPSRPQNANPSIKTPLASGPPTARRVTLPLPIKTEEIHTAIRARDRVANRIAALVSHDPSNDSPIEDLAHCHWVHIENDIE